MEFLGIGLPELFFIVLIALIVLGPKDMVKAGRTIGTWLRTLVTSPGWQTFMKTSREIRTLPNKLMRDAGIEDFEKATRDLRGATQKALQGGSFTIAPPEAAVSDRRAAGISGTPAPTAEPARANGAATTGPVTPPEAEHPTPPEPNDSQQA